MRTVDYDLMHALEAEFWWFVGMRRVMGELLRRHWTGRRGAVLDVGCGTGINLLWMAREFRPEKVIGCDYSETAIRWTAESVRAEVTKQGIATPRLTRGDVRRLPFPDNTFDLACCFDVLDSLAGDGDVRGLSEIHRVLRPGGVAVIRAPAYQWLLSSHDTLFETCRRFSVPELAGKMAGVGFRIEGTTYANTVLFPLALVQRLLRKYAGHASDKTDTQPWPPYLKWLNGIFESCMSLEAAWIARGGRLPFGLSAACIGAKVKGG